MPNKTTTEETIELMKSLVRPFLICTSWVVWLSMIATGQDIPIMLGSIAGAITGEYALERAVKRIRGK